MIEITDGFTSISTGADWIDGVSRQRPRAPTGARVTLEFSREMALPPGQPVRVRYDFGGDGVLREAVAIAKPTRTIARWGRAVAFHYRLSHWITPEALGHDTGNVRYRTDKLKKPSHDLSKHSLLAG